MSYSKDEIRKINKTTSDFYKSVSDSFSSTRQHEWDGWKKCLSYIKNEDTILDLGCGNRRFSKFLIENNISAKVDNYDNFAWDECVKQVDIIDSLLNDNLNLGSYDVAVCFGLMHHIPSFELREKLLTILLQSKIVIVSFWQFAKDIRIFQKAQNTTNDAFKMLNLNHLEDNDYFLGWQEKNDIFRFCHNFTDAEIENIKNKFNFIEEFSCDGKEKNLNKYIIFRSF